MNAAAEPTAHNFDAHSLKHMSTGWTTTNPRRPENTMTPPNLPYNSRAPLPDSLKAESSSYSCSVLRLRLAEPPLRTLEARLEHALQMLDAPSAPLISMLRFQGRPRPSARSMASSRHQEQRP